MGVLTAHGTGKRDAYGDKVPNTGCGDATCLRRVKANIYLISDSRLTMPPPGIKRNSRWGAPGPGDGSACTPNAGESGGSFSHAMCVAIPESTNGPVCDAFHCANPSAARVEFCVTDSSVCVEFTAQPSAKNGWSCAFCPTLGRSTTVGMPSALRVLFGPMPEFKRMCGVPTAPAESIISLDACATKRELPVKIMNESTRRA